MVEAGVDLDPVELSGIVLEPSLPGEILGIEQALPVVLLIVSSGEVATGSTF
jgi:hypothetical protein